MVPKVKAIEYDIRVWSKADKQWTKFQWVRGKDQWDRIQSHLGKMVFTCEALVEDGLLGTRCKYG